MRIRSRSVIISIFIFQITLSVTFAADKTNIAVTDLAGQGVDQSSTAIISDRLRTELFNTGTFKVIERQSMNDILKEQGFQQTGCTSDQCMVEIGQLLGVAQIVSGQVRKIGGMFTLNIRMIDVKTGEIVYTTSVDCRCAIEDVLTNSVPSIASKIAASAGKPVTAVTKTPSAPQVPSTGSLHIQTDPTGARISVDNADMGLTPFTKDSIGTGKHAIKIQLDGYDGVESNITVSAGVTANKNFSLNHTKAWKDSVESTRRAAEAVGKPQKKHSIAPKLVFGLLAVGTGIGGIIFNSIEQSKINDNTGVKQAYAGAGYSNASYYQGQLDANNTAGKNSGMMRNICYIAAGACATGFAISLAF